LVNEKEQMRESLSLKEYLLQGYDYFLYLKKKWIFLLIAVILGSIYGFYKIKTTPTTFVASLTFMINEDDGNSYLGAGELLSQFGLGAGGSSENNLDKISALASSRRIVGATLLDSVVVDNISDLLANHIIEKYKLHDKWNESEDQNIHNFLFVSKSNSIFSDLENSVLMSLHGQVVGSGKPESGLFEIGYVPETGIMHLIVTTVDEDISLALCQRLYHFLSDFYTMEATQKQLKTLQNLVVRLDSVGKELSMTEYQLAVAMDKAAGIYSQKDQMGIGRLSRQVQYLSLLYGEIATRKEASDFILKNTTPFFQVIDRPLKPLRLVSPSLLISLFYSNLFAGITVIFFLLAYKVIKDTLQ
jgi:hypothetical protein